MGNQPPPSTTKNNDTFIIEFNKNNCAHNRVYDAPLCSKRVIFISLIGLFQSYRSCPPHILNSSLLIMPLKKEWIYANESPSKYIADLQSISSGLIRDDTRSQQFFELLKWKDSQGLVLWAKDEYKNTSSNEENISSITPIHPFWQSVSDKLLSLYDPITSKHYNPLVLDEKHWTKQIGISSSEVHEMCFRSLKFECITRVLNASNPKSFRVLTTCPTDLYTANRIDHAFVKMHSLIDDDSDAQTDDEWWVSPDYC